MILERLLFATAIEMVVEMVVLDPNSDYVGLGDLLPADASGVTGNAHQRPAERWADLARRVVIVGPVRARRRSRWSSGGPRPPSRPWSWGWTPCATR